ncbi:MAG: hypothetical protein N2C14_31045 [Planctomycetales bacterium]
MLSIIGSTVSGNFVITDEYSSPGGGVSNIGTGTITIGNSIVSGNSAPSGSELDFYRGMFITSGSNLFGHSGLTNSQAFGGVSVDSSNITATSDGSNPTALGNILDTNLNNNGGPTQTHALIGDSPAIDAGDNSLVTNPPFSGPPFYDQRGTGFPRILGARVDLGSVESEPPPMVVVGTDAGSVSQINVFNAVSGTLLHAFAPYGGFTGGVRLAAGDVSRDGRIVTGSGPGAADARVFSVHDGSLLNRIVPFGGFTGGVFVATGDVNNDGFDDVIVSADAGAGPHVKVFSGADNSLLHSFYAYGAGFQGGVRVASGDVNNDGFDDIITASGPGAVGDVRVFSGETGMIMHRVVPYNAFTGGVHVASGDLNNDGNDDIITGAGPGAGPHVSAFDGSNPATNLASFLAFDSMFSGGVRVGSADVNNDGFADIITGSGSGNGPQVKTFGGSASFIRANNILAGSQGDFLAFGAGFTGGIFVSGGGTQAGSPAFLQAAAGEDTTSNDAQPLSDADAARLVDAAIDRLANAGYADADLDALRDLNVAVTDLEGATLGLASGDTIFLDVDAAGHGWFLDDTPYLDEEFAATADGSLQAIDSEAADRIDLLTVALHELGHQLGWQDLAPDLHDLMAGALDLGVRKTR